MCPSEPGQPAAGRKPAVLLAAVGAMALATTAMGRQAPPPGTCLVDRALVCTSADDTHWRRLDGHNIIGITHGHDRVYAATSRGVHAFELASGAALWQAAADRHAFTPSLSDSHVWVGTRSGELLAIDPADGRVRRRIAFQGWVYSPAIAGDRLVVTTEDHYIQALDEATGHRLWRHRLPQQPVGPAVRAAPDTVVVGTYARTLQAFRTEDGAPLWRRATTNVPRSLAAGHGRLFQLDLAGAISAYRVTDGALVWRARPTPPAQRIAPVSGGLRAWLEDDSVRDYPLPAAVIEKRTPRAADRLSQAPRVKGSPQKQTIGARP